MVGKARAGFNVTTSDNLGFGPGLQSIYNQGGGVNVPLLARTWSDSQGYEAFLQVWCPMPIQMVNGVVPPSIPNVTES